MFTGLIQSGASVKNVKDFETFRQIRVGFPASKWKDLSALLGSSIALNGVCLTLVGSEDAAEEIVGTFDVSPETLKLTNFSELKPGDVLHFEGSLKMGQELGGHWVLGHVDGVGRLSSWKVQGEGVEMKIEITGDFRKRLAPLVVDKGSIALDGVSLTINAIEDSASSTTLSFFLIPHTLLETRFAKLKLGAAINIELDLVGKYIVRAQKIKELGL